MNILSLILSLIQWILFLGSGILVIFISIALYSESQEAHYHPIADFLQGIVMLIIGFIGVPLLCIVFIVSKPNNLSWSINPSISHIEDNKDQEIYKSDIIKLQKMLESKPINVFYNEGKAMAENRINKIDGDYREIHQHDNARYIEGRGNATYFENYNESQKTLAQAAQEIQNLLKTLEEKNPTATEEQQIAWVNSGIPLNMKQRCIGALKKGGETAIEEFLDNSYAKIVLAIVKGWIEPGEQND